MCQSQSPAINTRPKAHRLEPLTALPLPRPTQVLQLRDHPGLPRRLGYASVLTSPQQVCEFCLVSRTLAWAVEVHSDSRTGLLTGGIRYRRPSTYNCISSHIPSRFLHRPSSTFSRRPNRKSSYSIRPVTPLRFFLISPFSALYTGSWLSFTLCQAAQIPKELVSIYFA